MLATNSRKFRITILQNVIYGLGFAALLSSCSYINDIGRTGEIISKEMQWSGAGRIEILAPVHFVPVNSDTCCIRLTGVDFIVNDYLITDTSEKLVIEHKKQLRIQEDKMATLEVYGTEFSTFFINSPCKIGNTDSLTFSSLQIIVNGNGAFMSGHLLLKGNIFRFMAYGGSNRCRPQFSGKVNSAYFHLQGGSDAEASGLSASTAVVEQRSTGNCSVAVSDHLKATVYSTGNIYCTGNPETAFSRIENSLMQATGQLIFR